MKLTLNATIEQSNYFDFELNMEKLEFELINNKELLLKDDNFILKITKQQSNLIEDSISIFNIVKEMLIKNMLYIGCIEISYLNKYEDSYIILKEQNISKDTELDFSKEFIKDSIEEPKNIVTLTDEISDINKGYTIKLSAISSKGEKIEPDFLKSILSDAIHDEFFVPVKIIIEN